MKQMKQFFLEGESPPLKIDEKLVGHGQKWVWTIWSLESKIDCISRNNRWN